MTMPVILAAASTVRRRLLENAGVPHEVMVSAVDEDAVKQACRRDGTSVGDTALRLAVAKAQAVSEDRPDCLVIGADQILECEGRWFDKPVGRDGAAAHLRDLQGRTHHLITAAVVVEAGLTVWQRRETLPMTMRVLSDEFIDRYLDDVGEAACQSVGAYQLEGLGAQLFQRTAGDFFSILGLPLLPLLEFLRQREVLGQ